MHKCPNGFKWCPIKKKCIPEGSEIKDKLMMKNERFFFKEDRDMDRFKDASRLVDIAFDESFEIFGKVIKAERKLEKILDTISQECSGMGMGGAISGEESYDEFSEPDQDTGIEPEQVGPNTISHVPNQDGAELYATIRRQLGEWKRLNEDAKAEYRAYFDKMLKKYGVSSPAQLPADKKKEFFNAVDAGWKSKKEKM